jgi:predicted O-methyltransferase YrrM
MCESCAMALERLAIDEHLATYLDGLSRPEAPLSRLYDEMSGDEWAMMMTHPDLGRLLAVLVRASGGRTVLEIGTFVGTSATWMAGALAPGGHIDTLELDAARADRAEAWLARAGVADRVRVHRGPAGETLARLPPAAYDLAYIDADKTGYPEYLEHAVRLVRPGGMILADNVLADGRIGGDPGDDDDRLAALRAYNARAMADPRLRSVVLTVGDGVTLSVVAGA